MPPASDNVKLSVDEYKLICHAGVVPDKAPTPPGPIGAAVAANVEAHRAAQNLSYAALSRRLAELGRPIPALGLTRIRDGQRKVDADDLVALALALEVSPATLLLPPAPDEDAGGTALVTERGGYYPRRQIWNWLISEAPIDAPESVGPPSRSVVGFRLRAVPGGVGPLNFVGRINFENLPASVRKFLEDNVNQGERDDDGHD